VIKFLSNQSKSTEQLARHSIDECWQFMTRIVASRLISSITVQGLDDSKTLAKVMGFAKALRLRDDEMKNFTLPKNPDS